MKLQNKLSIPASTEEAWRVLLDIERVTPCVPGATLTSRSGDGYHGSIKVKLGPIALTYHGSVRFLSLNEQDRTVVLEAGGRETRGNGTAKARVTCRLVGSGDASTDVFVDTDLAITGKPAQFGRGTLGEVAGTLIGRFAENLARELAVTSPPHPASAHLPSAHLPSADLPSAGPSSAGPSSAGSLSAGSSSGGVVSQDPRSAEPPSVGPPSAGAVSQDLSSADLSSAGPSPTGSLSAGSSSGGVVSQDPTSAEATSAGSLFVDGAPVDRVSPGTPPAGRLAGAPLFPDSPSAGPPLANTPSAEAFCVCRADGERSPRTADFGQGGPGRAAPRRTAAPIDLIDAVGAGAVKRLVPPTTALAALLIIALVLRGRRRDDR
ncbi:SRPBCC domain-containing protein [Streptomyces sp. NPDC001508]|uniref:SRPBCC family protein n=1 Tax=Streptomyces sp. NPDC001508 TaxID=3154656 RepID=UPI003320393C